MILTFILGLIGGAAAGIAVMALVAMAKDKEDWYAGIRGDSGRDKST